jgi:hypothetical protein
MFKQPRLIYLNNNEAGPQKSLCEFQSYLQVDSVEKREGIFYKALELTRKLRAEGNMELADQLKQLVDKGEKAHEVMAETHIVDFRAENAAINDAEDAAIQIIKIINNNEASREIGPSYAEYKKKYLQIKTYIESFTADESPYKEQAEQALLELQNAFIQDEKAYSALNDADDTDILKKICVTIKRYGKTDDDSINKAFPDLPEWLLAILNAPR